MNSQSLDSIARFCIDQHDAFDANAWLRRGAADGKMVGVVAKYLSMSSWFGNETSLGRIATEIHPDTASITKFNREMRAISLEMVTFSETVRCGIAAKKGLSVDPDNAPAGGECASAPS